MSAIMCISRLRVLLLLFTALTSLYWHRTETTAEMTDPTFHVYPGDVGKYMADNFHYSTAVRIGDKIECAGQGMLYSSSCVYLFRR